MSGRVKTQLERSTERLGCLTAETCLPAGGKCVCARASSRFLWQVTSVGSTGSVGQIFLWALMSLFILSSFLIGIKIILNIITWKTLFQIFYHCSV